MIRNSKVRILNRQGFVVTTAHLILTNDVPNPRKCKLYGNGRNGQPASYGFYSVRTGRSEDHDISFHQDDQGLSVHPDDVPQLSDMTLPHVSEADEFKLLNPVIAALCHVLAKPNTTA